MEPLISHDENDSFFSNLPSQITIDILTRLPIKILSRCRCVCKPWVTLISSPEFADLRKSRLPPSLMVFKETSSFNMVELENEPTSHDFYYLPGSEMKLPKGFPQNSVSMFGSINGLICFHEFGFRCKDRVRLWNPTTRESITIPSPGGAMEFPNITTYGFGLSSVNGHYKVVRIYQELQRNEQGELTRIIKSECHVYTFGEGSWRLRGNAPFLYSCRTRGVFFHGNLHWLITDPDGPERISCFDLENETFRAFPGPPDLENYNLASLEVYNNKNSCLSVCDNSSDFEITIWLMKEYGVKESWVKQFVIDKHPVDLTGKSYEVVQILKVFEDGEILMLWRDDLPLSFDPKNNLLKRVEIKKLARDPESPEFANLRESRLPPSLMVFKNTSSFNMVGLENDPASNDFYYLPDSEMKLPEGFPENSVSMFGSINGLICFHEFGFHCSDEVRLWNPMTWECITIPSPGGIMESPNRKTYGFGLSSTTGHYKVVRIYQELQRNNDQENGILTRIMKSECHVYTFGTGCWRLRGHAPFLYSVRTHGIFHNGNLHWLITDPDGPELISCFNLEKETFRAFPGPPELEKNNLATLEVYNNKDDNCLSVCDNTSDFKITIWLMKEYGVKESWVKQFVIDKHQIDLIGKYYEVVQILKVFEDGEILMLWRDDQPLSFDPKNNLLKRVEMKKLVGHPERFMIMEVVDYVPSFVSLKSFGNEMVKNTF
ncbi:OLC1v1020282C1 [Oldenlandia corymbosa var. corymbosa]|uniref:OLC1v1020282C1 n=1 Tax=Oldenlandia corymbosa var. corymbosa TaxID=529605 RepID=A0AAV1EG85_OLDCO|nr:OLC1v1020282C1 [Oldenlandia corymbosa var. corymbosa]